MDYNDRTKYLKCFMLNVIHSLLRKQQANAPKYLLSYFVWVGTILKSNFPK